MMKIGLLIISLFVSTAAMAECNFDFRDMPSVPNGAEADILEMYNAQEKIKTYVKEGEQSLECARSGKINAVVIYHLHKVADAYNRELRVYNQKVASL